MTAPDPAAVEALAYRTGDIAVVEGRVAIYMPRRWEWMDGTWTAIPLSVGPVTANAFDLTAAQQSGIPREAVEAAVVALREGLADESLEATGVMERALAALLAALLAAHPATDQPEVD